MTTPQPATWADIRAEIGRSRVTVQQIADRLGVKVARFSTILNADSETNPTPEFAERVLGAIRELAGERAA